MMKIRNLIVISSENPDSSNRPKPNTALLPIHFTFQNFFFITTFQKLLPQKKVEKLRKHAPKLKRQDQVSNRFSQFYNKFMLTNPRKKHAPSSGNCFYYVDLGHTNRTPFALIKGGCVYKITGGLYAPSAKIHILFFTTWASKRPHRLYLRRNCVKPSFFRHPNLLNCIRRWRFQAFSP